MKKFDKILAVAALLTIIAAWFVGYSNENNNFEKYAVEMFPSADLLEEVHPGIYSAYLDSKLLGYISFAEGYGYGGPLNSAVKVDTSGYIRSVKIISNKETVAFFQKAMNGDLLISFESRKVNEQLIRGENIDIVSGATLTSKGVISSVEKSNYKVARYVFNIDLPEVETPLLSFGTREILLTLIIAFGLFGFFNNLKIKKTLRWISLLSSLLILGFIYTIPVTLSNINSLLMGYWPGWHDQMYWYLMIGVVFLPAILKGANPYCTNICPFGAAQECLRIIGGGKVVLKDKAHSYLRWLQRFLAWGLIVFALISRNPGIQSHEIFGAFFSLTGTFFQLILMAVVIITALFIKRSWCSYLCPVQAVTDYLKLLRNWIIK